MEAQCPARRRRGGQSQASPPTFHGFGCLDELRDGASYPLGVASQLLLQVVAGLLQDLRKEEEESSCWAPGRAPSGPT